jgi:threonine dehydrogenase-like Zn-dependent dehydrogenase
MDDLSEDRMPAEKRRRSLILVDALVKENKEKSYTYTDLPEPRPGEGELLVRPIKVGLCGSDIHFYEWTSG